MCLKAAAQDIEKTQVAYAAVNSPFMALQRPLMKGGDIATSVIPGFSSKKAIAIFVGTQGVGADFRYGFLPRLSARIGGGVTPVNMPNAFQVNDFKSQVDLKVNFVNAHLIADFQPFPGSGFRLAVGAGYFVKAKTQADVTPTGSNTFGNITYDPGNLGDIKLTADWKGIAPYLGVGFLRTFPGNLFNVNIDLGTYYLTAPQTTIIGTKALSPNAENNAQFQKNLSSYRWLPVLQFNFNFRL